MDVKKQNVSTVNFSKSIRELGINALFFAGGFLAASAKLPFGVYPFGFALLGSVEKRILPVLLGCLATTALGGENTVILAAAYALTFALRALFSMPRAVSRDGTYTVRELFFGLFSESYALRASICAIGAFSVSLFALWTGGFLYYDLFGALLSVVCASVGASVLRALPLSQKKEMSGKILKEIALILASFIAVYALRPWSLAGISASATLCMLITLTVTRKKGVALGALTAIFSGLAVSVTYAPSFVFASICFWFLSAVSLPLGCFAAFAAGTAWGIYMDGIAAISSLFPSLAAASLLFFVIQRLFLASPTDTAKKSVETTKQDTLSADESDRYIAIARLNDTSKRIKALCEGLYALSQTISQKAEATAPYTDKTSFYDKYSAEFGEEGVIAKSADIAIKGGSKKTDISAIIGDRIAIWSEPDERAEARSLELLSLSDYLADIMINADNDYGIDTALSQKVSQAVNQAFPAASFTVCAFGGKRKKVTLCSKTHFITSAYDALRLTVEKACEKPMEADDPLEIGDNVYITFSQAPVLDVSFACKKMCAAGETEFCGDSADTVKESDSGTAFAFISDGMGSGKQAAAASQICAQGLKKLLPANVSGGEEWIRATLRMLNGFLRGVNGSGERECSATVDLGVFDLLEAKAEFYKSGAAPTYVFRDGSLFKLRAHTVPIGIIKDLDVGRVTMEILPEDVIIMVSDGVTGGDEECPALFEELRSRLLTHTPENLADAVLSYAKKNGSTDDVSVIVAKVTERVFEKR